MTSLSNRCHCSQCGSQLASYKGESYCPDCVRYAPRSPAATLTRGGASIADQHGNLVAAGIDALRELRKGIRGDSSGFHAAESILECVLCEVAGNAP